MRYSLSYLSEGKFSQNNKCWSKSGAKALISTLAQCRAVLYFALQEQLQAVSDRGLKIVVAKY